MAVLRRALLPLSLLTLVAALLIVPLPLYVEQPGRLVSLAACVEVAAPDAEPVAGDYLLTTVNLVEATTYEALRGAVVADAAVVRKREVLPPGVDPSAFFDAQADVFATTADVAAAVGLEAAGFEAEVTGDGVSVVRALPDTPAAGVLFPGDVVTAVDGEPVRVDADLRAAVAAAGAGATLRLSLVRDGTAQEVAVTPTLLEGRPVIGVEIETANPRVVLPVPVEVASGAIGGPSAGLMIAVTVYDKVSADEDLAAGRRVAGTGTIDEQGRVGPIGGIRLKVIAAHRAGVDVFLAPASQLAEARAGVPPGGELEVVGVADFDAARAALARSAAGAPADGDADAGAQGCPYAPERDAARP